MLTKSECRVCKALLFLTICFQIFFAAFCVLHSDELYFNPMVKPVSYEEWSWLVEHPDAINEGLAKAAQVISFGGGLVFVLGFLYLCTTGAFQRAVGFRKVLILALFFFILYGILVFVIRTVVPAYKLFMIFLPVELLSLLVLIMTLMMLNWGRTSEGTE